MMNAKRRLFFATVALAILALAPVPAVWISFEGQMPEQRISHTFGIVALMCMCLSMVISARPPGVDWAFAGLDKAYVVHKWLGLLAWITLLIHDTLEAEIDGLKSEVTWGGLNWHQLGSDMGVWVYNGILVLLAVTFLKLVPYRWWALTHRFMVVIFALSAAHFIVIPKPLALSDFGALYVLAWCIAGLVAAAFALRPAAWRGGTVYRVEEVVQFDDNVVSVELAPNGAQVLRHRGGQFVMLRGEHPDLLDWHPFTVSAPPQESGCLRITFALRERWTRVAAKQLKPGATLRVRGPHGRFFPSSGTNRQVWLSAGVGITPFLAWSKEAQNLTGEIDIVHICKTRQNAPHLDELNALASAHPNITLKVYETAKHGRPSPQDLLRLLRDRDETIDVFYCGPAMLLESLQLARAGARKARFNILTEAFDLRTDIPVPRPLVLAWRQLTAFWQDELERWGQRKGSG